MSRYWHKADMSGLGLLSRKLTVNPIPLVVNP
jgi:hypothetical protein